MKKRIVEWAPFKVKPGVSEEAVMKLAGDVQESFMTRQPGYQGRQVLKAGDDEYVDLIWWDSIEDAEAAMARVADSSECSLYFAAMDYDPNDPASHPLHFTVLKGY